MCREAGMVEGINCSQEPLHTYLIGLIQAGNQLAHRTRLCKAGECQRVGGAVIGT